MTATMTTQDLDTLIDGHYAAEVAGDLDAVLAGFTDDVVHDLVGRPEVNVGKEAAAAFYRGLLADLRLDRIESIRRWHAGDTVIDEAIVHATAIGTPLGLAGRNRMIHFRLLHVFEVRDGRIARESAWIDTAAVTAQLG